MWSTAQVVSQYTVSSRQGFALGPSPERLLSDESRRDERFGAACGVHVHMLHCSRLLAGGLPLRDLRPQGPPLLPKVGQWFSASRCAKLVPRLLRPVYASCFLGGNERLVESALRDRCLMARRLACSASR
jgi:hypothetical protein